MKVLLISGVRNAHCCGGPIKHHVMWHAFGGNAHAQEILHDLCTQWYRRRGIPERVIIVSQSKHAG